MVELKLTFQDITELKTFLMESHPFGAFLENSAEVMASDEAVKKVRKGKKKEDPAPAAVAVAAPVEAPAPAPAPIPAAPVEPVPMAAAPAPVPVAAPAPAESALASAIQQAAPVPAPAPIPAAPVAAPASYTSDDLCRAAATLVEQGKQPEVLAIVQKYGVQSMPELPIEQYAAFAADLRAIGGAI